MESNIKMGIIRYKNGSKEEMDDIIICEMPLNIFVNNQYYATLMCTPSDLTELCTGFLFSQGIVECGSEIKGIEFSSDDIAFVTLDKEVKLTDIERRTIVSGCGSGIEYINITKQNKLCPIKNETVFTCNDIQIYMNQFNTMSDLFNKTSGVHSCCLFGDKGIKAFSDDIGRHNAIDKTIGKCILNNVDMKSKMLFSTGRISSDSVIKAARAGIPVLVSHSCPTSLAVDVAKHIGMTLIGFVRVNRMSIYCGAERVKF